ncbi:MAG: Rrf2 family transcriptional regulator [Candidatus Omnitrophica bacterium]|nr:Rrf2 family transcriptional regulator [Candidatus Omnitrophota bacterium]
MKLITRNIDYAVRALLYIARSKKEVISVSELVEELNLPKPFLRRLLQTLHKRKVLKAYKGYGGGFSLALSPRKIYLGELIRIFKGNIKLNECIFKRKLCPNRNNCPLRRKIKEIENYAISKLESTTISSLLD